MHQRGGRATEARAADEKALVRDAWMIGLGVSQVLAFGRLPA